MTFNALVLLRQRLRRRRRRIALGLVALLVIAVGAWGVLVEGTLLRHVVAWVIGRQLGATCTIEAFHWNGWHRASLRGLSLHVDGWPGVAAEVVSIRELSADFDPLPLLWGSLALTDIRVSEMTLRAIEREGDEPGINIMALRLPAAGGAAVRPPRINIQNLLLEIGTVAEGSDAIAIDTQRELVGSFSSDRAVRGRWNVELTERAPPESEPLTLYGWLVGETFEYSITLSNLTLDRSLRRLLYGPVREVWRHMNPTGRIDQVQMHGDRAHPVRSARIEVSNLDLTLPDPGIADAWVTYRDLEISPAPGLPRIEVQRGVVRFDDWRLSIEQLRGRLTSSREALAIVPLPVELRFDIDLDRGRIRDWDGFDPEAWAEAALEHAPFELHLTIPGFAIAPVDGQPPVLELPRAAAEIFSNFMVREGTVSIEAHVTRGDPFWRHGEAPGEGMPDEGPIASEVHFSGAIAIQGGRGGYFKFPYQLSDVRAHITFDDDVVNVHYLRGRGSEDAQVSVTGTVYDPGDDAGVDLIIASDRVPIDEELESALRYSPAQRFLTLLFNRSAYRALVASGLIERTVEAMEGRREALIQESMALESSAGDVPAKEARLAAIASQLKRLFVLEWLRRFAPGGWCAMNLRIQREVGGGEHVVTTGTITLLEAQALCEPLPYPMFVGGRDAAGDGGATISIEDERILLPAGGLRIELPGGGRGLVRGSIDMPRDGRGGRDVTPHVTVTTGDDAINPLLLAAIPLDNPDGPVRGARDGWPGIRRSEVADIIDAIGLSGVLASTISIGGDGHGGIDWRAEIELTDGAAEPRDSIGMEVAESGLEWPAGFRLERCRAAVAVDERLAVLRDFEGWHGTGRVQGTGRVDLVDGDRELHVRFDEVPAGPYLINLLPHQRREEGRRFWEAHEPEGVFSAVLDWTSTPHGDRHRTLRVVPLRLAFTAHPPGDDAAPERVSIRHEDGEVAIVGKTAYARELRLAVEEPGLPISTLLVDGGYGATTSGRPLEIGAAWNGARFESPLLAEGLHLTGAQRAIELWHDVRPRGGFDAILTYRGRRGDDPASWRVRVEPAEVTGTFDGVDSTIRIDAGAPPIVIEPDGLRLTDLHGRTENGRFSLDGVVPFSGAAAASRLLRVTYDGSRVGPPELALMGRGARRALEAIELKADGPVRLRDGELLFRDDDGDVGAAFRGVVSLEGAAFRAGVDFEQLDATVRVAVDPARTSRLEIEAPSFRVMDRPVRRTNATVLIEPDGSRVEVPSIDGELAGGSASAGVSVRIDEHAVGGGHYEVWTKLVGAQLAELPAEPVVTAIDDSLDGSKRGSLTEGATGRVDGEVVIGGPLLLPERRAGRGRLEIRDGHMADLPITMSLLQVSHFMLPLNTALDSGDIRFHISGDRLVFDRFELASPTIEFRGTGELDLRNDEISLRLQNRGTLPIWSDLFGAVYDTLFAIDVTGPLNDPSVSVAPLPSLFSRTPVAGGGEAR